MPLRFSFRQPYAIIIEAVTDANDLAINTTRTLWERTRGESFLDCSAAGLGAFIAQVTAMYVH